MEKDPSQSLDETTPYQIGARLILLKLLEEVHEDWNGCGAKIWATQNLKEIEDELQTQHTDS